MILTRSRRFFTALFARSYFLQECNVYSEHSFTTSRIIYRRGINSREDPVITNGIPSCHVQPHDSRLSISNIKERGRNTSNELQKREKTIRADDSLSCFDKNQKLFRRIMSQQLSRKQREKKQQVLFKGADLIQKALSHGASLKYLFYSKDEALHSLDTSHLCADKIMKVRTKEIQSLSGNRDLHHLLALCSISEIEINSTPSLPVTIVCNNIRDPDNLGAVVSLGAATGCKSILLTEGCADVWEHKVIAAAGGGHFYIPIKNNIKWTEIRNYLPENCTFYIADSSSDLILNEIPIDPTCTEDISSDINFLEHRQSNILAPSDSSDKELKIYENFQIPCHLYCSIQFPKKNIVIFMGGETHGIDENVEKLGLELQGQKIKIPLENGMDSLNVSAALSIVLFEIKRQFKKQLISKS